jgi:ParB family chromosome partitioning protein
MSTEAVINQDLVFELKPEKVILSKELPRRRKDMGEIEKMMESIKQFGQLQPIVINQNNELIYGGRRLAACTLLGQKVRACYKDTIDPVLMRELELEENIQRKDFTPAEECLAIEELVLLKQEKYGTPTQGKEGGYTLTNAAEAIGKTKGSVIEAMKIADMVKAFPKLSEAKTKSEIKKTFNGLQRVGESMQAMEKYKKEASTKDPFKLVNKDSIEHMKELPNASIDLLFTDPPYGIDIHDQAITTGGKTGGKLTGTGTTYDDSKENALGLIDEIARESFRFTKPNAHALVFLAPSNFKAIRESFLQAGWLCAERPVIWIKQTSGQNNQPDHWFSSAYEMLLFARKIESKIVIPGKADWVQCDKVTASNKIHQAEKPVILCKELISRLTMPGQTMYDPCVGSGALVEAGCRQRLFVTGCELSTETYSLALSRLMKWKEGGKN